MTNLQITETLTVALYDSIKEFPADAQLLARLFAVERSALSSTVAELAERKNHMSLLLQYNKQEEYQLEEFNYQLSVHFMEQGYNPAELGWACHIYAIDGVPVTGYSEDAVTERLAYLKGEGLTSEMIGSSLILINESMNAETKRYFPKRAIKGKYNNLQRLVNYGLALAAHAKLDSEESRVMLDKAIIDMLSIQKPINLQDRQHNVLIELEKSQFKLYANLQESGNIDPRKLTVYEFYGWLEIMEERYEQQKAALNNKPSK